MQKISTMLLVIFVLSFCGLLITKFSGKYKSEIQHKSNMNLKKNNEITISPVGQYLGKINLDNIVIRLLILKHCPDKIADEDANQVIQAANIAASKNLNIKTIGNYRVNKNGKTDYIAWGAKFSLNDLEGLKKFVSQQMKIDATPGDTFIIYTIGHGSSDGSLMRLGQRANLMKILAEAAEENGQETFWWQLSCYAASHLPPISSLNEKQQKLFSMSASSPANEVSYFTTQGRIFSAMFNALTKKSLEIDPDQNNIITAGELSQFISSKFGSKRGRLIFARSKDEPIFGLIDIANMLPIIDRNNPQGKYPSNYIPSPK